MTERPLQRRLYTIEVHLRLERESEEKHEYRDGQIIPMHDVIASAGGSHNHSLISANLTGTLGNALKSGPHRAHGSLLGMHVPLPPLYTYPDAMVICGKPIFDKKNEAETITNPAFIAEVISPSSEAYDRGDKFNRYRTLESLKEYMLVSQDTARVELYFRQEGGTWLLTPVSGIEASARLSSLGISLALSEIYAGVEFPQAPVPPESSESQ